MKFISEEVVKNKSIVLRVDFNVEINEKGEITDEYRIKRTLPTIVFLKENKAKRIVLISHLKQPTADDFFKEEFSLLPVKKYLEEALKEEIYFLKEREIKEIVKKVNQFKNGEIILLENIRFFKGEEENDENFAKELSHLGEIYINEAFSASHRESASLVKITNYLPSYGGFLLKEEIETLNEYLRNYNDLVLVLGGLKVEDKLPLIENFLDKAKYILTGGAIANTILKGWGFKIGKSVFEEKVLEKAKNLGSLKAELILPGDLYVLDKNGFKKSRDFSTIRDSDTILDIGKVAASYYKKLIKEAKMVIYNGPMGKIEEKGFEEGTLKVFEGILENKKGKIVIGGGDTLKAIKILNLEEKFNKANLKNIFLSTGGGAMLFYLAGKELPALKALN